MLFVPFEIDVLACELVEMSCNVAEMWNEFAVIANKSQETLNFRDVLERYVPVCNSLHLIGIDSDLSIGYDMAKIFDRSGSELAFFSSCSTTYNFVSRSMT